MKKLKLLSLTLIIFLVACNPQDEVNTEPDFSDYSVLITGINKSLSYDFASKNGRTETSVPQDVNMLQLAVVATNGEVVYEQYYYNHNARNEFYYDSTDVDPEYFENTLPDTLLIPRLLEGEYSIIAATSYIHNHSYYDYNDTSESKLPSKIEAYTISDGPIYVGKEIVSIEENQEEALLINLDMNNISARIDLNIIEADSINLNFELQIEASNANYYSFENDELLTYEYNYYGNLYWYFDGEYSSNSIYFLPRLAESINISFFDENTQTHIHQSIDLDPDIEMNIGDVLTLNIDIEKLLEGTGETVFNWEEVDWNDVGEISIP